MHYKVQTMDLPSKNTKSFWSHPLYWVASILTIVWVGLSINYFIHTKWWSNRYYFSPAEFMGTLTSQIIPVVLIWGIIIWLQTRKTLRQETSELREYISQMINPTKEGAIQTKLLNDALREQVKEFREVFNALSGETAIIRDELKKWTLDFGNVIDHIDTKTTQSMNLLNNQASEFNEQMTDSFENIHKLSNHFDGQIKFWHQATSDLNININDICANIAQNISYMKHMSESLNEISDNSKSVITESNNSINAVNHSIKHLSSLFNQFHDATKDYNSMLFENTQSIISVLKSQEKSLNSEVNKILDHISDNQAVAEGKTEQLIQLTDKALTNLTNIGVQMEFQAGLLEKSMDSVCQKMDTLSQSAIPDQIDTLRAVQDDIDEYLNKAHEKIAQDEMDMFMKDARVILTHLSSFSIDIASIFKPEKEDELWQKYYSGDTSAFMRYLLQIIPSDKGKKIKAIFQNDTVCRDAITRYMNEFDTLIARAKKSENKEVFMPVLIGSDAGRLYMLLNQILKGGK